MQEKTQLIENQNEKITPVMRVFADLLSYTGKNARNLALKTGLSETQVSRFLKGEYKTVSPKVADKILSTFPELSRVCQIKDSMYICPCRISRSFATLYVRELLNVQQNSNFRA